jgi:hypothetical protein
MSCAVAARRSGPSKERRPPRERVQGPSKMSSRSDGRRRAKSKVCHVVTMSRQSTSRPWRKLSLGALSPLHLVNCTRHRRHFAWRERSLPGGPRLTTSGSVERSEIERGPSLLGAAKIHHKVTTLSLLNNRRSILYGNDKSARAIECNAVEETAKNCSTPAKCKNCFNTTGWILGRPRTDSLTLIREGGDHCAICSAGMHESLRLKLSMVPILFTDRV